MTIMAFTMTCEAQNIIIGPEVGYERTNIHIPGNQYEGVSSHAGNGFRIGANASYGFGNGIFIQSGIYYSLRGGSHIYGINGRNPFPYVRNIHLKRTDFLTLPLTVGYELPFCSKWGVGIEIGGYVGTGLGSGSSFFKCTNGEGSAGSVFDDSLFTVGTPDGYDREKVTINGSDRIDAGCTFGAHVRFDRFRLRANYQLGLCKTIYDMAIPRTFTLSLSYDFKL